MKLSELTRSLNIIDTNIDMEREFDSLTDECDKADANNLFICLKGEKNDGNSFATLAAARGAAIICEKLPEGYAGEYLIVENCRKADSIICSNLHHNPESRLKMIGVTGTNGKTSVCHLLRNILEYSGHRTAMCGTICNYVGGVELPSSMTTPKTKELYALMEMAVNAGDEYFIAEVSSHALAYHKFEAVTFLLSVFTNLSPEHMDFHADMEEYSNTKAELFKRSLISLINADDAYGNKMYDSAGLLRYKYSPSHGIGDFTAIGRKDKLENGIEYYLLSENCGINIVSPIPGINTLPNTLCAASAAILLGAPPEDIARSTALCHGISGRLERVTSDSDIDVYIDFAHTPEALKNLMISVRGFSGKRKITLLFGCGGDRDKSKRPRMGNIASTYADRVIITSDNPRSEDPDAIINDILSGVQDDVRPTVIKKRAQALEYAIMTAEKNEIIVAAGKGHENYEIDQSGKHPFSERDIIEKALAQRCSS